MGKLTTEEWISEQRTSIPARVSRNQLAHQSARDETALGTRLDQTRKSLSLISFERSRNSEESFFFIHHFMEII
jgi:hypothetical protein